jgi:hypothetical protein
MDDEIHLSLQTKIALLVFGIILLLCGITCAASYRWISEQLTVYLIRNGYILGAEHFARRR